MCQLLQPWYVCVSVCVCVVGGGRGRGEREGGEGGEYMYIRHCVALRIDRTWKHDISAAQVQL